MGLADSEERLGREMMDKVYRLCDLWRENPGEGLRCAVERRLQEMLFKFPWLVGSLNPVVMDFLLSTVHLHSYSGCSPARPWIHSLTRRPVVYTETMFVPPALLTAAGSPDISTVGSVSLFTRDGDTTDAGGACSA